MQRFHTTAIPPYAEQRKLTAMSNTLDEISSSLFQENKATVVSHLKSTWLGKQINITLWYS